ncbi:phage NrS-1 polymerase family protein [Mitsuokella sp.]|uniref:phage NrS-1 polymerase family protein n=1 Tax=Mitsuokella sp. TaxID=2049034 RepID=UPI003D7DBA1B
MGRVFIEKIPNELQELRHWVGWITSDKMKIPLGVDGEKASIADRSTWGTLQEIMESGRQFDGVGFVLTGSPYMAIDIDDCMDGGELQRRAFRVVEKFGTYAELSPSGYGVHIIGRGKAVFPSRGSQDGRRLRGAMGFSSFEVYNEKRFVTFTGCAFDEFREVRDVQEVTDRMTAALWKENICPRVDGQGHKSRYLDSYLLGKASGGRRGTWFRSLYEDGDTARYGGDISRADFALLSELAFWTGGDACQMERIFSSSALGRREKWRTRADYRKLSIDSALSHWNGKAFHKSAKE